jgi:hypothetical protein
MDRARLAYLLRRAASLPPHRVVAKAAEFARHGASKLRERRRDFAHCSYSSVVPGAPWRGLIALAATDIAADLHKVLRLLGECYLGHRFDLLGSGWVEVRYGMACQGFLGRSYAPQPPVRADSDGAWITAQVNRSNLAAARDIWRRVDPAYQPIDWQLDFRSGYRWRADAHHTQLSIPVDSGADVKVPWELGRLQHLPQLALCAVLADAGTAGFEPSSRYVSELRWQLLDFLALNPPRFGVNWMCPMDVGIRIANILLATDILIGAELHPGTDLIDLVIASARDHAVYIADHLEWSETGRGNHYLANLVGLLWAVSYLPSDEWTNAKDQFAAAELLRECELQFGSDGGNYEGSSNYHRLSTELVLFGVALLLSSSQRGLGQGTSGSIADRTPPPTARGRERALRDVDVPLTVQEKLFRASRLMRAMTRPDGDVIQIGDTDSGRLFKLTPAGRADNTSREVTYREDALDPRSTIESVDALFDVAGEARTVESVVVRRLAAGNRFPQPTVCEATDHGDIDRLLAAIDVLPEECRRRRYIRFQEPIPATAWQRAAFPSFGLYMFRTDRAFIAFRCWPRPSDQAPLGHTHDDNLSIEYLLGAERRIDPGTVCYTPSRAWRNRYRDAEAHDVVRAIDWDVAAPGDELFSLAHVGWANCLAWRPNAVAGAIAAPHGRLTRILRLDQFGLEIVDGVVPPDRLRPIAPQIDVADGYGNQSIHSVLTS